MNSTGLKAGLIALMAILILVLGLSAWLLIQESRSNSEPAATPISQSQPTADAVQPPTVAATLPPPVIQVLPSATPTETPIPTDTPPPTETPLPTATPEPTATPTNTPVPVVVAPPPTAIPPTAVPPTAIPPTPVPVETFGLAATHFGLQPRSQFNPGGQIWFEFTITNSLGAPVSFGALGVMPKKDGVDRPEWYQHSYGGNNDAISVNGLNHEDRIILNERGNYTLRLVICFADYNSCRSSGPWVTLTQEIPVTIN